MHLLNPPPHPISLGCTQVIDPPTPFCANVIYERSPFKKHMHNQPPYSCRTKVSEYVPKACSLPRRRCLETLLVVLFPFQGSCLHIRCSPGLVGRQDNGKVDCDTSPPSREFDLIFDQDVKPFSLIELPIILRADICGNLVNREPFTHKVLNSTLFRSAPPK